MTHASATMNLVTDALTKASGRFPRKLRSRTTGGTVLGRDSSLTDSSPTARSSQRINRLPGRCLDGPWDIPVRFPPRRSTQGVRRDAPLAVPTHQRLDWIRRELRQWWCLEQRLSLRCEEHDLPVAVATDLVATLVDPAMMAATQEQRIVQLGLSAVRPVHDVVGVGEAEPTAWEATPTVSDVERTAERRRNRAGLATHVEHGAVG